jgi:hypothetical protein
MSPIKAASYLLTESNKASQANAKAFNNLGVNKAIFIDEPGLDYETRMAAAKSTKEAWNNEATGVEQWKSKYFSSAKIGAVDLGLSPVDLDIIEAKKMHVSDMCMVYNFPVPLLSTDASTFNNFKTAMKALITGPVMKFLNAKRDSYNRMNSTYWGGKPGEIIDYDVACYGELAEDGTEKLKALNMGPATVEEYYRYSDREIPEWLTEDQRRLWIMPGNLTANAELFDAAGGDVKINGDY